MPVACLLVVAALAAAQPLPVSHAPATGEAPAMVAAARRATAAMRNIDLLRHGKSPRRRPVVQNADPPRLASGYRAAQLDLRWHAPDVTGSYPR